MIRIVSAPSEVSESPPDLCADCVKQDGLCTRHIPSVCPNLAQPGWYRHAHSGMYHELRDEKAHSPEALRLIRRKERRRAKRLRELVDLIAHPAAA